MPPAQIPPQRSMSFVYHLLALLLFATGARAATYYNLDFEQPVHQLGAAPTVGASPDRVSSVSGSAVIAAAPAGLTSQAVQLHCAYHNNPGVSGHFVLNPVVGQPRDFTISYDAVMQFNGSPELYLTLQGASAYAFSFTYSGGFRIEGPQLFKTFGSYSSGTVYHVSIDVLPSRGLWIGRINGVEMFREAYTDTQVPKLDFNLFLPFTSSSEWDAYLDNVVVADYVPPPYYHVTFEEPVHHAEQLPTLGGAPDKASSITGTTTVYGGRDGHAYGPISIVTSGNGQSLRLLTASPSGQLITQSATFDAPATANPNLTLSFYAFSGADLFSVGLPGVGCSVVFDRYLSSIHLRGPGNASKDIAYSGSGGHVMIEVLPQDGLWIGTINGTEVWREPYNATQPCGLSFAVSTPFQGVTTEETASVDDVVIADFALNKAPSFTKGADVTVSEDAPAYSQAWATAISAGSGEDWQRVNFEVTPDHPELFAVAPAISPAGLLTFTPAPNAYGQTTVTVLLRDDGTTTDGGVNVSAPQTFTINLTAVNDSPTFTAGPSLTIDSFAGAQSFPQWATQISSGPPDEAGQTVSFTVTASSPANQPPLFSVQPAISAYGTLSFTPSVGASGISTLTIVPHDSAGATGSSVTRFITLLPYNHYGYYRVTFEEPVHHLGGEPTVGTTPDTISHYAGDAGLQIMPTIVAAPAGLTGQALKLNARAVGGGGGPLNDVSLNPIAGLPWDYTISFDLLPQIAGAMLEFELNGASGYSVVFSGSTLAVRDPQGVFKNVGTFTNGTVYQVAIDVSASQGIWVGRLNGTEVFREPCTLTQPTTVTWASHVPANGFSGQVYLDNVVIGDIPPNRAPSFTKGADVTVLEDSGAYSQPWTADISAGAYESNQTVTFEVINDQPALFSVAPAISPLGVLTFTPAADAFGHANVTVRLFDNGGTDNGGVNVSAPQTFTIDVAAVNDPPTLDPLGNLALLPNAGPQVVNLSGITPGASNETATLQVTATSSAPSVIPNPQVSYTSPAATGTLTFTPVANATGLVTIQVTVAEVENPGVKVTRSFTVRVTASPSFTKGPDVQTAEDSMLLSGTPWATDISTGGADPADPVSFEVTTDHPSYFSAGPTITQNGDLSFTTAPDAFGQATATVRLHVGNQVSDPATFTITLTPVNDPPSFTAGSSLSVRQHSGASVTPGWATQISAGPNESEAVHFVVSTDHPEYFSVQPSLSPTGTLSFTPKGDVAGTAVLIVYLEDAGGLQSAAVSRNLEISASTLPAGAYHALVQAPTGESTVNAKAGRVDLLLTKSGQFTGRIVLHRGQVRPLTGKFSPNGVALFGRTAATQTRLTVPGLPALDLQFHVTDTVDGPKLTGLLSYIDTVYAEISGGLAAFTAAKNPLAPFRSVPESLLGRYTVALTPQTGAGEPTHPAGSGYAFLNVSRNGTVSLNGRTSDDRAITWSGSILDDLTLPIYIPIIAGRGSLSGFAHFRDVTNASDVDGQDLHWSSPQTRTSTAWDGVRVVLAGSKYTGTGFAGLQPASHTTYLAQLAISWTGVASVDQSISITDGVAAETANTPLTLKIIAETGAISGNYKRQDVREIHSFRGIILSKQSTAYGYFIAPQHGAALVIVPQ